MLDIDRVTHIPAKIWTTARQAGQRNGTHDQTVKTAEMLLKRRDAREIWKL